MQEMESALVHYFCRKINCKAGEYARQERMQLREVKIGVALPLTKDSMKR
jgi:hypothetical protein